MKRRIDNWQYIGDNSCYDHNYAFLKPNEQTEMIVTEDQKIKKQDINKMIKNQQTYVDNFYQECFINIVFANGLQVITTSSMVEILMSK